MKKICSKCKKNKDLEEYYKNNKHKDGKESRCKSCTNAEHKKYCTKNRERKKEYDKKYYIKNKGRIKENNNEYYIQNKQKILEYFKEYRKSDEGRSAHIKANTKYSKTGKGKLADAKYRKSEKGRLARDKRYHNRRINESKTLNNLTINEKNTILFLQNYKCIYPNCNEYFDLVKPTLDHIKPLSKGGDLIKENVQFLCKSCNSKKHDKEVDYRTNFHKYTIINQFKL